ncbi:hypothetical protein C8F04DRAFT_1261060 [Mycena alexandri]|uniref:F-box domain-containing protein n=1 Tax=Mycena alexandri TaxID=1745969 RepID=A0AAD6X5U2_9AGAR|nr:hypothetical protein C8F04DRAFT_1261060 [Mycena alexandri]
MAETDDDVPELEDAWVVDNSLRECPLSIAYIASIRDFDHKSSTRHINDLPPEILTKILQYSPIQFHSAPFSYDASRYILRMVSPTWNSLVEAEPALWSHIYIGQHTVIRKLALWIQRAGSMPISLAFQLSEPLNGPTVFVDPSPYRSKWLNLLATVSPIMAQCVHVSIQAHNPQTTRFLLAFLSILDASAVCHIDLRLFPYGMHVLRHVDNTDGIFTVPLLFANNTPSLQYLAIYGFFTTWGASPILTNLTTLRLQHLYDEYSPTVDELFTVLGAAPRLETLYLLDVGCIGYDNYTVDPPPMASLVVLYFSGYDEICSCLFSIMPLPTVTTLQLQLDGGRSLQVFLAHCGELCRQVTILVMDISLGSVQVLIDIFQAFPNVEHLDARAMAPYFTVALHSIVAHWTSLCPALGTILVDEYVEPFLLHLIHSRANDGLFGRRPLHIISPTGFDTDNNPTIPYTSTFKDGLVVYNSSVTTLSDGFAPEF